MQYASRYTSDQSRLFPEELIRFLQVVYWLLKTYLLFPVRICS